MSKSAFTLVEILIVVAIIAMLAAIAIPNLLRAQQNARVTRVANNLRKFGEAFQMYSLATGLYPADTHLTLPAGMEDYINQSVWDQDALGGNYNWEGPAWGAGGSYAYAGISITGTTASTEELTLLDTILDNGDLNTGQFRLTPNSRYTYIWEE